MFGRGFRLISPRRRTDGRTGGFAKNYLSTHSACVFAYSLCSSVPRRKIKRTEKSTHTQNENACMLFVRGLMPAAQQRRRRPRDLRFLYISPPSLSRVSGEGSYTHCYKTSRTYLSRINTQIHSTLSEFLTDSEIRDRP